MGITAAQVSAELGISPSVLYRWQRELAVVQEKMGRPSYEDLENELRRLRVENDFLKKLPVTSPHNHRSVPVDRALAGSF